MKKSLIIAATVIALGAGSVWAFQNGGGDGMDCRGSRDGGKRGRPPMTKMVERALNDSELVTACAITEEQLEAVNGMLYQNELLNIDLMASEKRARMEMFRMLHDDKVSEVALLEALTKCKKAEFEIEKADLLTMLSIRNILGEETMKQLRDASMKRRGKGMNRKDSRKKRGMEPEEDCIPED